MKQLLSVTTKSDSFTIGQKIKTGLPGGPYRNWTVPKIEERDDGWITVHLERIKEELWERTSKIQGPSWTDCHSGMCLPPHWVISKMYIEVMEEQNNG